MTRVLLQVRTGKDIAQFQGPGALTVCMQDGIDLAALGQARTTRDVLMAIKRHTPAVAMRCDNGLHASLCLAALIAGIRDQVGEEAVLNALVLSEGMRAGPGTTAWRREVPKPKDEPGVGGV